MKLDREIERKRTKGDSYHHQRESLKGTGKEAKRVPLDVKNLGRYWKEGYKPTELINTHKI